MYCEACCKVKNTHPHPVSPVDKARYPSCGESIPPCRRLERLSKVRGFRKARGLGVSRHFWLDFFGLPSGQT